MEKSLTDIEPKLVPLANSDEYALVDEDDYRKVMRYEWRLIGSGKYKYAASQLENQQSLVFLNRFIYGSKHLNHKLSYINGNRLDCTRKNIELANQNLILYGLLNVTDEDIEKAKDKFLKSSFSESGYMGVSFCRKSRLWKAKTKAISPSGQDVSIGYFETKEMAALAYYRATEYNRLIYNKIDNERWWNCH